MRIDDLEALTSRLLVLGSIEAALTDLWTPHRESLDPRVQVLSHATRWAARALIEAHDTRSIADDAPAEQALRGALSACLRLTLPAGVALRVPEGFAYYGVHPLAFDAVVRDHLRQTRPASLLVLGIRTIGATLGAIAAARGDIEGVPTTLRTVRPRGHPFDRQCDADAAWMGATAAPRGATCLVVDEGPGLSGTSLTAVAELLERLGHARECIVFVCSHDPDPELFRSERAAQRWRGHTRLVAPMLAPEMAEDWSAGQWRQHRGLPPAMWPAVHPQHERHKGVARDDPGTILKFVGIGPYGHAVRQRAESAAAAGFAVPVHGLHAGYLRMTCLRHARTGTRRPTPAFVETLLRYLPWRAAAMQTGAKADADAAVDLLETNTRLQHGQMLDAGLARAASLARATPPQPAVVIDGRLFPWEWLEGPRGLLKVDSAEHGDDHFQPGPHDIGWDAAAVLSEFGWGPLHRQSFIERLAAALRDPTLERRLRWLVPCYLASRMGYASLAAESLAGTDDGVRFARQHQRYARQLARALA